MPWTEVLIMVVGVAVGIALSYLRNLYPQNTARKWDPVAATTVRVAAMSRAGDDTDGLERSASQTRCWHFLGFGANRHPNSCRRRRARSARRKNHQHREASQEADCLLASIEIHPRFEIGGQLLLCLCYRPKLKIGDGSGPKRPLHIAQRASCSIVRD